MTTEREEYLRKLQEEEIACRTIKGKEMTIREAIERGARALFGDTCIIELLDFEELHEYCDKLDTLKAALKDEKMEEQELIRQLTELQLYASHGLLFPYQAYLMGITGEEEEE